jgi:hypothetical protein
VYQKLKFTALRKLTDAGYFSDETGFTKIVVYTTFNQYLALTFGHQKMLGRTDCHASIFESK